MRTTTRNITQPAAIDLVFFHSGDAQLGTTEGHRVHIDSSFGISRLFSQSLSLSFHFCCVNIANEDSNLAKLFSSKLWKLWNDEVIILVQFNESIGIHKVNLFALQIVMLLLRAQIGHVLVRAFY